jgi:hypothetical protein
MEEIINAVKRTEKSSPRSVLLWKLVLNAFLDSQERTPLQVRNLIELKLEDLTKPAPSE